MKHLKLFEQFEDEEEPWWDEESEFDNLQDKLHILKHKSFGFFCIGKIFGDKILLLDIVNDVSFFHTTPTDLSVSDFNLNPEFDKEKDIIYYFKKGSGVQCKYEDLPKEIKNRLV